MFSLFVNPDNEDQISKNQNIQGQNAQTDVNHDHGYCLTLSTADTTPTNNANLGNATEDSATETQNTDIMKGYNDRDQDETTKGYNAENQTADQDDVVNSTDSEDESITDDTITNTAEVTATITDMWAEHAKKDLGYVPLTRLSRLDIYDLT